MRSPARKSKTRTWQEKLGGPGAGLRGSLTKKSPGPDLTALLGIRQRLHVSIEAPDSLRAFQKAI